MEPGNGNGGRPAPPFDPELLRCLEAANAEVPATQTPDMIPGMRADRVRLGDGGEALAAELVAGRPLTFENRVVPGPAGVPELAITILRRSDHTPGGAGIYHLHGGGMISGTRFSGIDWVLDWVEEFDAVAVTVEYRLAPEHPDPAPVEDCYAGLVWTADHAGELGFDPEQLLVVGASAGGGLTAGVALLARDRRGPAIAGQVVIYGMLDDRNDTISSHQFDGVGIWDRTSNDTGWNALLGDRRHTERVSIYAAPARAEHLGGLPPAYLEVGSAEVFRDEVVAFASGIWAAGGVAELHVWPGGFHSADLVAPEAQLSRAMIGMRTRWARRLLQRPDAAATREEDDR